MQTMKRKTALLLTLLLLVSCMTPAASAAGRVEWAGTYSSPDNNTVVTYPLPTSTSVEQVWASKVGNSTITIVDDYIYTCHASKGGGGDGTLYKIDKDSGEVVDSVKTGLIYEEQYSHIAYGDGLLYISVPGGSSSGTIAAYHPDTLQLVWKNTEAATGAYAAVQYVNGFVVSNGKVFDGSDGTLKATLTGTYNWANGAEVNDKYYVAAGNFIRAFDTTTWEQRGLLNTGVSGGSGAGVMHYNGRLYWGDQAKGKFYSVALNEDGTLNADTFLSVDTGDRITFTTPVAYGRRVYLACNTATGESKAGTASVLAFDAQKLTLERTVTLPKGINGNKIQSTPILHPVTSGGAEQASAGSFRRAGIMNTSTTTAYIYVQDYHTPGKVYMITDDGSQTEGDPIELITPSDVQADFAYEQLACDTDGAIYCTTDKGYLMKWQTIRAQKPVITADLSTAEVVYALGAAAEPLQIEASVNDDGELSYQWFRHTGNGWFTEIEGAVTAVYTPSTDREGTTYYKCVVTNRRGNTVTTDSSIARITVVTVSNLRGDADNDNDVDADDVARLIQYLAERKVTLNENNADVNGDGKIDLVDLIRLRRHVVLGDDL